MEEKAADEDGGAGGEVPHVQDGADEGDAAQLPVVAGDRASFVLSHTLSYIFSRTAMVKIYHYFRLLVPQNNEVQGVTEITQTSQL